jgi:hypothetical protein
VVRAIREMRNKNVTDDDVPGDMLKLLDGLQLRTQLINNIHGTGRWTQDINNVTTIALKKPKSYKMHQTLHNQPHCTNRKNKSENTKDERLQGKLRMYLENISLDLEEEKKLGTQ